MRWIVIVGIIFLIWNTNMTNSNHGITKKYEIAYSYIKGSTIADKFCRDYLQLSLEDCRIAIADSSVFMEYSVFTSELIKMYEDKTYKEVIEYNFQRDRDRKLKFEPLSVKEILNLPQQDIEANLGLFFSVPYERTLMAELLASYDPGKSFHELTQFNIGVVFLFFFDNDGNIKKVLEKVVHYN